MEYSVTFNVIVNALNEDDAERIAIQKIVETTDYTSEISSLPTESM